MLSTNKKFKALLFCVVAIVLVALVPYGDITVKTAAVAAIGAACSAFQGGQGWADSAKSKNVTSQIP